MSETSEDFDFEVCECFAKRQAKNLIKHPKEIMKIVDERRYLHWTNFGILYMSFLILALPMSILIQ